MRDRQTCIDCGKQSPETETNYTLISAQFGWRLTRRKAEGGEFVVEWRCPDCWRKHKQKHQDEPSSVPNQTSAGYASGSTHAAGSHSSGSQVASPPSSTPSLGALAAAERADRPATRTTPPPRTSRPPPSGASKSSKPPPAPPSPSPRKRG